VCPLFFRAENSVFTGRSADHSRERVVRRELILDRYGFFLNLLKYESRGSVDFLHFRKASISSSSNPE